MEQQEYIKVIKGPEGEARTSEAPMGRVELCLRWFVIAIFFSLFFFFQTGGTTEGRVLYLIVFVLGFLDVRWGLYTIALVGPLFIMDQSNNHLLVALEVLVLGIVCGQVKGGNRSVIGLNASGDVDTAYSISSDGKRVHWGLWPQYVAGLLLILLGSALIGIKYIVFREQSFFEGRNEILNTVTAMFYGAANNPEWTLKSYWNWGTGLCLAIIFARYSDPLLIARCLKLGGISLLVTCFFALLDYSDLLHLSHIRRANPDPLHAGRLQGTAGHAGWFAQWIVLLWPGVIVWMSRWTRKRVLFVAFSALIVGTTLILTAARAAWLGFAVSIALLLVYALKERRELLKPVLLWGSAFAIVALIVVLFFSSDSLIHRLKTLLQAQDRINYYVSGLWFLQSYPQGIGLGMHGLSYDWTFTPFFKWYQSDHMTAHSLWLHTLIENGVGYSLLLLLGVGGVLLELKKSWKSFDPHVKLIVLCLLLSLAGILTVSIAQYIFYIRVVELMTWSFFGLLVGLCRKSYARVDEPVQSIWGPRVLLLCGVYSLIIASFGSLRTLVDSQPRYIEKSADGLTFWSGLNWSTVVSENITEIQFEAFRLGTPAHVKVSLPSGEQDELFLQAGETQTIQYSISEGWRPLSDNAGVFEVSVSPGFTPSKYPQILPDNTDHRMHGVYIKNFVMKNGTQ